MASYYKHSGKFAPQGPILGLLGGIVISVPAAYFYDYALFALSVAKLRIFLPFALGLLLGAVCGALMSLGKVRSKSVAAIVGFAVSSFGLYVSWLGWIGVICLNRHVGCSASLFRPLEAWKALLVVNPQGTWSLSGTGPMHGAMLWLVWALEALAVLAFGTMAAMGLVLRRPFCERCGQWCKKQFKLNFAPSLSPNDLKAQLESGDIRKLEKLAPGNKKQPHYRIHLHSCNVCHQLNTLTLQQIFPRNILTLMNKLLLTADQAAILRNIEMNRRAATAASAVPYSAK
jgi:hypothetical protein